MIERLTGTPRASHAARVFALFLVTSCASAGNSKPATSTADNRVYLVSEVTTCVQPIPGGSSTAEYPKKLREAGVEGEVVTQFVVDEQGHVVLSTIKILRASDFGFGEAVMAAFPRMRFQPALIRDKPVRQLVKDYKFIFKMDA